VKWNEALERRGQARALLATAPPTPDVRDEQALRQTIDVLFKVIRLDPGFHEARWRLAELYDAVGDLAQAREHYLAALALEPTIGDNAPVAARLYRNLARIHEICGDAEGARRTYNRFLTFFPLAREATPVAERLSMLSLCGSAWFDSYVAGARAQLENRHEAALTALEEAARLFPSASCVQILSALSMRKCGGHDSAIACLERALEIDPHPRTYVELGATYGVSGNPYVEEGFYFRALEASPHDTLAMFHLGAAAYARKDRDLALESLQRALKLAPDAPWAEKAASFLDEMLRAGEVEYPDCLKDPVEWRQWTHEMLGVAVPYPAQAQILPNVETGVLLSFVDHPENRVFYFVVRRTPTPENFERDAFLRQLRKSFQQEFNEVNLESAEETQLSGLPAFLSEHRERKTDFMLLRAWIFRDEEIFEFWCRSPWVVYRRARPSFMHMLNATRIMSAQELFAWQRRVFEERLASHPREVEALAGLGAAAIGLGDFEYAQEIYTRLLRLDPDNARALGDLGVCYFKLNRLDLAVAPLTKATAQTPTRRLLRTLGLVYELKKQPDKAIKVFLKALEGRPDCELLTLLGGSYESLKKYDLAEAEYKKALTLDPHYLEAKVRLGSLYGRIKRPEEGVKQLKEAIAVDGKNIAALMALAALYMDMGYWDMAEKTLHQVWRIDPNFEGAQQAMDDLAVRKKKSRRY
jgi:tetratricopeptide (TPR) repeat protein